MRKKEFGVDYEGKIMNLIYSRNQEKFLEG